MFHYIVLLYLFIIVVATTDETGNVGQRKRFKNGRLDRKVEYYWNLLKKKGGAFTIRWYRGMRRKSLCLQEGGGIR